jgi:DNA-directed RNA polymerase subunit RPC12/RpoP
MTPEPRILACPQCGAPLDVPESGGQVRCDYCKASIAFEQRPDAPSAVLSKPQVDPAWSDEERERRRLAELRRQADDDVTSPYSTFDAPPGLEHLELSYDDPLLPGLMAEAFRKAVQRCTESRGDLRDEQRVTWIAGKAKNVFTLTGDVRRSRGMLETARELVRDAGFQHALLCELADVARKDDDLAAAQALADQCDPASWVLPLDSNYRTTAGMIAQVAGDMPRVLELVGSDNDQVPFSAATIYQACMMRTAALERLGRPDEAERAFRFNLEVLPDDLIRSWVSDSEPLAGAREVWLRLREEEKDEEDAPVSGGLVDLMESRHRTDDADEDVVERPERPHRWLMAGNNMMWLIFAVSGALIAMTVLLSSLFGGEGGS